jgi:hypothetical protein
MSNCRILDDDELEREQTKTSSSSSSSSLLSPLDKTKLREWSHVSSTKPFDNGFIKTTAFPRAFKSYHMQSVSTIKSTSSLVDKVKTIIKPSDNVSREMGF